MITLFVNVLSGILFSIGVVVVLMILIDSISFWHRLALSGIAGLVLLTCWYAAMGHSRTDLWVVLAFRGFLTLMVWCNYKDRVREQLMQHMAPKWIKSLLGEALSQPQPYSVRPSAVDRQRG